MAAKDKDKDKVKKDKDDPEYVDFDICGDCEEVVFTEDTLKGTKGNECPYCGYVVRETE